VHLSVCTHNTWHTLPQISRYYILHGSSICNGLSNVIPDYSGVLLMDKTLKTRSGEEMDNTYSNSQYQEISRSFFLFPASEIRHMQAA